MPSADGASTIPFLPLACLIIYLVLTQRTADGETVILCRRAPLLPHNGARRGGVEDTLPPGARAKRIFVNGPTSAQHAGVSAMLYPALRTEAAYVGAFSNSFRPVSLLATGNC